MQVDKVHQAVDVAAIKADLFELAVVLHNDKGKYTSKDIFGPSIIAADRVMPSGSVFSHIRGQIEEAIDCMLGVRAEVGRIYDRGFRRSELAWIDSLGLLIEGLPPDEVALAAAFLQRLVWYIHVRWIEPVHAPDDTIPPPLTDLRLEVLDQLNLLETLAHAIGTQLWDEEAFQRMSAVEQKRNVILALELFAAFPSGIYERAVRRYRQKLHPVPASFAEYFAPGMRRDVCLFLLRRLPRPTDTLPLPALTDRQKAAGPQSASSWCMSTLLRYAGLPDRMRTTKQTSREWRIVTVMMVGLANSEPATSAIEIESNDRGLSWLLVAHDRSPPFMVRQGRVDDDGVRRHYETWEPDARWSFEVATAHGGHMICRFHLADMDGRTGRTKWMATAGIEKMEEWFRFRRVIERAETYCRAVWDVRQGVGDDDTPTPQQCGESRRQEG